MKKTSLLATAVMLALLSGCSKKDSAEHYADAQKFMQNNNYPSAIIELKSAVQQEPENKDYRLALGKVHLKTGDVLAAAKELDRALSLGASKEVVAVPLFKSYYAAKDNKPILELFANDKDISESQHDYLNLYRALVELESGNKDQALSYFDELAQQQRNADVAAIAQSYLQIAAEKLDVALTLVAQVTVSSPLYSEALLIKARLQQSLGQHAPAVESFRLYNNLMPRDFIARLMLSQSLVELEKFDEADTELNLILKGYPNQPLANYLKAVSLYEKKDYNQAKDHAERAINAGMKDSSTRLLAALSAINLDLPGQALAHLDAIKNLLSANPELETLYASLLLEAGRADEVSASLIKKDITNADYKMIAATSYQLLKQGSLTAAQQLIEKYDQTKPTDNATRTIMATVKLGVDSLREQGMSELEDILKADPTQDKTRIILAQTYIRLGQFDKARALADQWLKDEKSALLAYNLKGYVDLLQNNNQSATEMLAKAEALSANNPFTMMLQAMVAIKEKDLPKSAQLLEKALQADSTYVPALSQYYAVSKAQNEAGKAVARAEQMLKSHPDNNGIRLTTAAIYLAENKAAATVATLTDAAAKFEDKPPMYWALLLNAHAELKNKQQVLSVAREWVQKNPDSVDAELSYANALAQNAEMARAIEIVDKHLKKNPNNQVLLRSKASYQADLKDYKGALATIALLGDEENNKPNVLYLKGRLLTQAGETSKAMNAFEQSYQQEPNPAALAALAELTASQKSLAAAAAMVKQHMDTHGENPTLQGLYANYMLAEKPEESLKTYQQLLSKNANDYVVLNNYAWLLAEQGNIDEAALHIEKALKLAPRHPDVLDTQGKILLMQGKLAEAQAAFETSLEIRPNSVDVKLHHAEALIKNGQKNKALAQLSTIENADEAQLKLKAELEAQAQ